MADDAMISAIIIFLNEERFLAEAIDSVLCQTYRNWELLLVDDGSTDKSPEIARSYVDRYPDRIRYLSHPGGQNRGMSASRNLGVAHAVGGMVSYLDADDVWLPNKLEEQKAFLDANSEAAFVWGPLTLWRTWQDPRAVDEPYGLDGERFSLQTDRLYEPPELLAHFLRHKDVLPAGILVRTSDLLTVGGGEDDFRGNYEDAVVLVKLCLRRPAYLSSTSWYLYRQHENSFCKTARRAGDGEAARLRFLDWTRNYLRDNDVQDRRVWAALRDGTRRYRHPRLHRVHQLPRRVQTRFADGRSTRLRR